jgi:hypothetical protein
VARTKGEFLDNAVKAELYGVRAEHQEDNILKFNSYLERFEKETRMKQRPNDKGMNTLKRNRSFSAPTSIIKVKSTPSTFRTLRGAELQKKKDKVSSSFLYVYLLVRKSLCAIGEKRKQR